MKWKTDEVMAATSHEDAIAEIAAHYFRICGASDSEAAHLIDHIYGALGHVEQEHSG